MLVGCHIKSVLLYKLTNLNIGSAEQYYKPIGNDRIAQIHPTVPHVHVDTGIRKQGDRDNGTELMSSGLCQRGFVRGRGCGS